MTAYDKMEYLYEASAMTLDACDIIKGAGACDRCPMFCIEDDSLFEIADTKTKGNMAEFFGLAQDIEDYVSDEDYIWDQADEARKAERDEWYD